MAVAYEGLEKPGETAHNKPAKNPEYEPLMLLSCGPGRLLPVADQAYPAHCQKMSARDDQRVLASAPLPSRLVFDEPMTEEVDKCAHRGE